MKVMVAPVGSARNRGRGKCAGPLDGQRGWWTPSRQHRWQDGSRQASPGAPSTGPWRRCEMGAGVAMALAMSVQEIVPEVDRNHAHSAAGLVEQPAHALDLTQHDEAVDHLDVG